MPFDEIEAKDFRPITWMFTRSTWHDVADCYKPYFCEKCKKLDWLAATQGGIRASPILPLKMPDFFQTSDWRAFIVNENTKDLFESYVKSAVTFFPIPNHKGRFVLLPNKFFFPPAKVPVSESWIQDNGPWRTEDPRCKSCKNFPDLCFNRSWFTVPDDVVFAGIR